MKSASASNPLAFAGLADVRSQRRFAVDWKQQNKVFGVDSLAQAEFNSDIDCYYGEGRMMVSSLTYDW